MKNKFRTFLSCSLYVAAVVAFLTGIITTGRSGGVTIFSDLARFIYCALAVICVVIATLVWRTGKSCGKRKKALVICVAIVCIVAGGYIDDYLEHNTGTREFTAELYQISQATAAKFETADGRWVMVEDEIKLLASLAEYEIHPAPMTPADSPEDWIYRITYEVPDGEEVVVYVHEKYLDIGPEFYLPEGNAGFDGIFGWFNEMEEYFLGSNTLPAQPEEENPVFKAGTWMAYGQYYFFDPNGTTGRTASYENGTGVGFTYAQEDGKTVFFMGAADAPVTCNVVMVDDDHLVLEWGDRDAETLTFLTGLGGEQFHFYTDEELSAMALEDYRAKHDPDDTRLCAAAADNGDGTATVQLYQNLGDHNSTAAWYQIDRCTGEGINVNTGDRIDLTNGSPDVDIAYFELAFPQLETYHECILDQSPYRSEVLLSALVPVTDFRVVSLEYTEGEDTKAGFRITGELFSVNTLTPEKPLVIRTELPEIIPWVGITYEDRNGEWKLYSICMSGLDGAPLLIEERLVD